MCNSFCSSLECLHAGTLMPKNTTRRFLFIHKLLNARSKSHARTFRVTTPVVSFQGTLKLHSVMKYEYERIINIHFAHKLFEMSRYIGKTSAKPIYGNFFHYRPSADWHSLSAQLSANLFDQRCMSCL